MKFMLLMHATRGKGDWAMFNWPQSDLKAYREFMRAFGQALRQAGEYVSAEGLASPGQARVVRAGKEGAPEVADGPFPDAREFLTGYWIVDVASRDRADELAAQVSAAPGRGGAPLNMPIEVREVMKTPSADA